MLTGTKHCRYCIHFYLGVCGQYCTLRQFENQYTENCPKRRSINKRKH